MAGKAIAATVNLLDLALLFEFLNEARKKAAASMLEVHAMCDFADARWLRKRGEVSQHLFGSDFRWPGLTGFDGVAASHDRVQLMEIRLTDLPRLRKVRGQAALRLVIRLGTFTV